MSDEFGVDIDEVFKVIDTAEVLIVRFHIIDKRLMVDFRTKSGVAPFIEIVNKAESVEDRFRSIKKLRPQFPFPEKVMSFHWPRSMPVMLASGVWQHLADRLGAMGGDDTTEQCGLVLDQLILEERREVAGAISGAKHYQTLWERPRR
jgi:hypothetical protein